MIIIKKQFKKSFLGRIVFLLVLFFIFSVQTTIAIIPTADRIEKCEKMLKNKNTDTVEDIDSYEKCERVLNSRIEIATQKSNILSSQVKLYNLKVNNATRNLENVEQKIERNMLELKKLEEEMGEKNKEMGDTKEQLKKNIVLYERNKQSFKLKLLDSKSSLVSLMNRSNYLNKISEQISNKLKEIKKEKEEIIKRKDAIENAKEEVEETKVELKDKKETLETERRIKNDFLSETKGDETKYKTLLARIEEQKQRIVNISLLSVSTKNSLEKIKRSAKKPKDGLASTSWYYAQNDPKWGYKTIGFSKTLMKDYGCAVTALSMVFTKDDKKIKPDKLAKKPLFYQDLIVWPSKWGKLKLTSGRSHGSVNWKTIDKKLKKDIPAVVFIRSKSGAGHYVVIHHKNKKGKYIVHDPLFGANIYLDTSKKLISAIYKSSVVVDQVLIYE